MFENLLELFWYIRLRLYLWWRGGDYSRFREACDKLESEPNEKPWRRWKLELEIVKEFREIAKLVWPNGITKEELECFLDGAISKNKQNYETKS